MNVFREKGVFFRISIDVNRFPISIFIHKRSTQVFQVIWRKGLRQITFFDIPF